MKISVLASKRTFKLHSYGLCHEVECKYEVEPNEA